jgi:hypothetical protein
MRKLTLLVLVLLLWNNSPGQPKTDQASGLVVWLIPSEPATPDAGIGGTAECNDDEQNQIGTLPQRIDEEINRFNAEMAHTRVTVVNTRDRFKAQMIDWSPEMAVPNWVWVRSQRATINALSRFADKFQVNIRVRFITWDRALSNLTAAWEGRNGYEAPDVVQIGSTWAGYLQKQNLLLSNPNSGPGWEDVGRTQRSILPYVNDAHLIFYWKRLPGASTDSDAFVLDSHSWENIVASLQQVRGGGPPFVFPIGMTLNLLHDYAPLVWAGGGELLEQPSPWGSRIDLTSPEAFSVPKYLTENSVVREGGRLRRLIAFPEASHEEAARSFVRGLYRATIEPANFIGRWRRDFACRYRRGRSVETFWKYAGIAVPPTPFRGGSYLAVWSRTASENAAIGLAEFLTADDAYTRMLARSGYLPSAHPDRGVNLLLGDQDSTREARDFDALVQGALKPNVSRSYPPIPDFSSVLESREVLERLQIAWRRMSEGDPVALHAALEEVEAYTNRQIFKPARYYNSFLDISSVAAPALAAFLLLLYFLNRRRISALRQVAQVRGFSAAGALLFERIHEVFQSRSASVIPRETTKHVMIVAALQGWRRGRDEDNWKAGSLEDVIWKSIILAFDSTVCLGTFNDWKASHSKPWEFLQSWLDGPSAGIAGAVTINATFPQGRRIQMPFMLEQALVCLLQNALKIVLGMDFPDHLPKVISIDVENDTLTIKNPGTPLGSGLCDAINESASPEVFEQRIHELLTNPGHGTPGFGLVEAYCILSQCYGGLHVDYDEPKFEVTLHSPTWFRRVLIKLTRPSYRTFHIGPKVNDLEESSK